ncbi:hypothetical protein QSJ18_13280 [Gordonia sp. ABSL1-1]|uniref:hypothetical protein n=1 Tax=Gordonia sp. ABSL1-1 TaxID=3053923 RepID=UPI002573F61B|nr:hypothetical protein [Gordonia sp. ABSL1-1]MDL9937720.1 hypothetical protein [Gordonia sp. ABSL1-1]
MVETHEDRDPTPSADNPDPSVGDVYRPLQQIYPPLGYASDGTPLFWPGQPTGTEARARQAAERRAAEADRASAPSEESPRSLVPNVSTTALGTVALAVLMIFVVLAGMTLLRDRQPSGNYSGSDALTTLDEPQSPHTFDPPSATEDDPSEPRRGGGIDARGHVVSYEVRIEGSATILYLDAVSVRSEFAPPPVWKVTFIGGRNPLRVIVALGERSGATCEITVDGQVVATDSVAPNSGRPSLACGA